MTTKQHAPAEREARVRITWETAEGKKGFIRRGEEDGGDVWEGTPEEADDLVPKLLEADALLRGSKHGFSFGPVRKYGTVPVGLQ